jgi:phosphoribosylanthranilate isomerase
MSQPPSGKSRVVEVRLFVKVCGLTRFEDVLVVAEAGADAFGLVVGFPTSPRNLSLSEARRLARAAPDGLLPVLVLNGGDRTFLEDACSLIEPYGVQLYGTDDPQIVRSLGVKMVIKPVKPVTLRDMDVREGFDAVLLDESRGSGRRLDLDLCAEYVRRSRLPVVLAGGLNPENVDEVVRKVRPFGVDASSGLESSPGVKDHRKVIEFVRRVRDAHAR